MTIVLFFRGGYIGRAGVPGSNYRVGWDMRDSRGGGAALSSGVQGEKSCFVDAFIGIVLQNYYHNYDWCYFETVVDIPTCTNASFHGVDPSLLFSSFSEILTHNIHKLKAYSGIF